MRTTATPIAANPVSLKLVMFAAVLLTALGLLAFAVRDTHWTTGVSTAGVGAGPAPRLNTPQDTIW